MSQKNIHTRRTMLARIISGLMMFLGIAAAASAQQWQSTFGGQCVESAYNGVQPVSTGGYIFTGVTFSPGGNCQNVASDIYVVKTNPDGTLAWSFAYDIGNGTDTGTCIRECSNGDFIVTGVTKNPMHSGGCNSEDIFLLRLNSAGGVIWAKTYGTSRQELSMTVIETSLSAGGGTSAGDFVVSGYTTNTAGFWDGYILRTNSVGTLIWDRTYPSFSGLHNEIIAVKESTIGPNAGHIIAVGSCDHNFASSNSKALLMVVNGGSGTILSAAKLTSATHMWTSELESVTEVAGGNIVATGFATLQRPTGPSPEIYVVKVTPALAILAQQTYGDLGPGVDVGLCVRENTAKNLIVAGLATLPGGFGGGDAFLMEINPINLQIVAPIGFRIYGGTGTDAAFSTEMGPGGNGYIIAGYTQSSALVPIGDPQQAYLIKTNNAGVSGCFEAAAQPLRVDPGYMSVPTNPIGPGIGISCTPTVGVQQVDWSTRFCYTPLGARRNDGDGSDGSGSVAGADPDPRVDASSMLVTPNPVKSGDPLRMNYSMPKGGDVTITVSDVSGKVVAKFHEKAHDGANQMTISTRGWKSGAYILDIHGGDVSSTRKIIVGDR